LKILSLNCWCGRALHPLMTFLRRMSGQVDVFCLQEVTNSAPEVMARRHPYEYVYGPLFQLIDSELNDKYVGYFATHPDDKNRMSQAMFVKHEFAQSPYFKVVVEILHRPGKAVETGSAMLTQRMVQYATIPLLSRRRLGLINCHGLWLPSGKADTSERLKQSERLVNIMSQYSSPVILCGDLNLDPGSRSLEMLSCGGTMRNLVTENPSLYGTRTPLFRHHDDPMVCKFADYFIVSRDVLARPFEVMPDIASDHAPLFLNAEFTGEKT
jgi:endonuclease/exonuclease/phosphatase family metal-dependent hydrolase